MSMALLMFLPDFSTILSANSSGSDILSAEATLINEYRILIKEQLHLTIKTLYHTKTPKFKIIYSDIYSNQRKLIPSLRTTTYTLKLILFIILTRSYLQQITTLQ